jgi:hypothetical protein
MSAPEGKTDVPREPGHFRFCPISDIRLDQRLPVGGHFSLAARSYPVMI